ncbi:WXG100 family type VII secretion target [Fodinicola feengrottensis]|uniref:WXG100 family type VII secretion target n=1 Tax=Fodinicola feengrottensis TaxID=435914 RepID=A0ABN2GTH6_9ACTN|nr:hypothetical protein [Fodinicola feengrottensis]
MVKFDMGAATLSTLAKQTQGSSGDLGSLIKQLVAAVTPLEGKFNGAGRSAFDTFKAQSDQVTADLNGALSKILGGQGGMNSAFTTGDQQMADHSHHAMSTANFDAARFGSSR